MTPNHVGDKLHHVDGTHRTTPPTASGHALESHQAALERHVADGHTHPAAMSKDELLDIIHKAAEDPDVEAAHARVDDALIAYINDPEIGAALVFVRWYA